MNHDGKRFVLNEGFTHVEVSIEAVFRAPRILCDVVFVSLLILYNSGNVHSMVVSGFVIVVGLLSQRRVDF